MPENKKQNQNTDNTNQLSRREFLTRTGGALSLAAASCAGAYLLYDKFPPSSTPPAKTFTVPSFAIPKKPDKQLALVKGKDRRNTVKKTLDLLGGIERFIKPGDTVLIKPNVAFAQSPRLGSTTHPDLINTVAKLCYDRGNAKHVIVADNPINDPATCFMLSGIGAAAENAAAEIIMPKDSNFSQTTLKNGKLITDWPIFAEPLSRVDKVIGIAPVKDHERSGASMTMKNWYGLLGGTRNIFHQDIHTIITELAAMITPTLVILDGTTVMKTNGPTGGSLTDLENANTMIAGTDQVAVDTLGATLLSLKPADLPYLLNAEKRGLGTTDYKSLKPLNGEVS